MKLYGFHDFYRMAEDLFDGQNPGSTLESEILRALIRHKGCKLRVVVWSQFCPIYTLLIVPVVLGTALIVGLHWRTLFTSNRMQTRAAYSIWPQKASHWTFLLWALRWLGGLACLWDIEGSVQALSTRLENVKIQIQSKRRPREGYFSGVR